MTPATGWHPDDYYRASRAARKAWQNTNQQLDTSAEEERRAAMMYGPGDTTIEWEPDDFDDLYVPPEEAGVEERDAARWEAADGGSVVPSLSSTPECLPRDGRKVDAAVCSGVTNDNRPR